MSLSKFRIRIGTGRDRIDLSAKQAGQIIVLFALMLTSLIGLVGIAIDVTYAWRNGLQVQRAADAAAMAGVVYLPGNLNGATPSATSTAFKIANANGYINGTNATVTADYAPGNTRQLDVQVTASVPTFFVRLFGINNWTITRKARAGYIMPVPMGSPLSYMGVGCFQLQGQSTPPPCASSGAGYSNSGVTTAGTTGGTPLGSLGAWGAISAPGGNEKNGDAYAPKNNGGAPSGGWNVNTGTNNVMYPASPPGPGANGYKGYFYTVTIPPGASSGTIQIFDPGFCAMGGGNGSGNWGAGDHWVDTASPSSGTPVSTYYYLWDTLNQPLLGPSNWHYTGTSSAALFENEYRSDTANGGPSGLQACSSTGVGGADNFHDKWWTLTNTLTPGTYEVEVSTTEINPTTGAILTNTSDSTNGQNMFAIQVSDTGGAVPPTVFGYDKMAVYNNLAGGPQQFYIAQVDKDAGAGKTLTIDLFDIGDVQDGTISILSPDLVGYSGPHAVKFNYVSYSYNSSMAAVSPTGNCTANPTPCQGNQVGSIAVSVGGAHPFDNTWIEITIPLSSDPVTGYGANGLWGPDSNPANKGWWQVQYVVTQASDLTTWSVNVNGNPVHLVPIP